MFTPSAKRTFSDLSPSSDSHSPLEKRDRLGSPVELHSISETMAVNDQEPSDAKSFMENYPEAPSWAVALYSKVTKSFDDLTEIKSSLQDIESNTKTAGRVADDAKQIAFEARDHCENLEDRVTKLEEENKNLMRQMQEHEDYSRKVNLRIDGLEEQKDETVTQLLDKVYSLFQKELAIEDARTIQIGRCHRIGRFSQSLHPRTTIVRFVSIGDRDKVWGNRFQLRKNPGCKIYLREDLSKHTEADRKILYPYMKGAKVAGAKTTFRGSSLIIDGKSYSSDAVHDIPDKFHPKNACQRENQDMIIFHGRESPFSNFHNSPFKIVNEQFMHTEQFYQFKKAEYFKDDITARKIKLQPDPLECMKLGFKVKNYKENDWQMVARNYMYDGNLAKFSQNLSLKDLLMSTGNKILAESSQDEYWGTGRRIYDQSALNKDTWTGSNHHGEGLMLLRDRLKHE